MINLKKPCSVYLFGVILALLMLSIVLGSCGNNSLDGHTHSYIWVVTDITYPATSTGTCTGCGETTTRTTQVGDTGPGNGKIFYINTTGFIITDTSATCHYLEAAPEDMAEQLAWTVRLIPAGHAENYIPNANGTAIGTGRKNTANILAMEPEAPAAKACNEYSRNSLHDWFLPSKDELSELYSWYSANGRGNFANFKQSQDYWSSSQYGDETTDDRYYAWHQQFGFGINQLKYYKQYEHNVRAVRAF